MPYQKFGTRRFRSADYSDEIQRKSLFGLFGGDKENPGAGTTPVASSSQGTSNSTDISMAPSERLDMMIAPIDGFQAENGAQIDQNASSNGVADQVASGDKNTPEIASPTANNFSHITSLTEHINIANADAKSENGESSEPDDHSSTQMSEKKAGKLPIYRHKRTDTAVKIVDRESADAVLLPSSTFSPVKSMCDTFSKQTEANPTPLHSSHLGETLAANKPAENTVLLPSVSYAVSHLPTRALPKIPTEKQKPDEVPSLPSSSYASPSPSHGVLKTSGEDKKATDKKVHFSEDDDDDDGYISDDSDKTVIAGENGLVAADNSSLSPDIWNEESKPKIYLKDGKPTLFQPTAEPDYYTNPLWSRQYPEILSDDPNVNPYAKDYADSLISQDGSESSFTDETSANTAYNTGPRVHLPYPGRGHQDIPPDPPGFVYPPPYKNKIVIMVGGRQFVSSANVLGRSPWFAHLFSLPISQWFRDGAFHIDNDPDLFSHIIRYLRTGQYPFFWCERNGFDHAMYAMILQQARFYLLPQLEAWIMKKKYMDVVQSGVKHRKLTMLESEDWVHTVKLKRGDAFEIVGVTSTSGKSGLCHGYCGASYYEEGLDQDEQMDEQMDERMDEQNGEQNGEQKANQKKGKEEIEQKGEEQDIGDKSESKDEDLVHVFLTATRKKVDLEALTCEYDWQFP